MLSKLLFACPLTAVCVVVHAFGLMLVMRWLHHRATLKRENIASQTWILIQLAVVTITLHLLEIGVWAFFYKWQQCLPDLDSSLYFSAVTYTTTGYGDIILPPEWRMVGAAEALTGILMCGWSAGFFFAFFSRLIFLPSKNASAAASR